MGWGKRAEAGLSDWCLRGCAVVADADFRGVDEFGQFEAERLVRHFVADALDGVGDGVVGTVEDVECFFKSGDVSLVACPAETDDVKRGHLTGVVDGAEGG